MRVEGGGCTVERHAPAPDAAEGGVVTAAASPGGVIAVDSATHRDTEKCSVRLER